MQSGPSQLIMYKIGSHRAKVDNGHQWLFEGDSILYRTSQDSTYHIFIHSITCFS
jgi:hypothetical protein